MVSIRKWLNENIGRKVKITGYSDKPPLGEPVSEGKTAEVRGALGTGESTIAFHDLVVYGDDFGTIPSELRLELQQHEEMINFYHKFCQD